MTIRIKAEFKIPTTSVIVEYNSNMPVGPEDSLFEDMLELERLYTAVLNARKAVNTELVSFEWEQIDEAI